MKNLASNKFVIIILAAIIIIAVSILMLSGDEKVNVTPNAENRKELSEEEMASIKTQYEVDGNKEDFEEIYNNIEQTVAGKFLDGTVTSDEELANEINRINEMFSTTDWDYLELIYPSFWMGTWSLDNTGRLYFTFSHSQIKPNWVEDLEMKDYIK